MPMILVMAYILPFMYISCILPSSLPSFLSTRVKHIIMMVTGVPTKRIPQGAEVVLGGAPAKIVVGGFSRIYSPCCLRAIPDKVMIIGILH